MPRERKRGRKGFIRTGVGVGVGGGTQTVDWRSGSLARLSLNFLGSNVPSPPEPSPYFIIGKNEQNEQNEMEKSEA